MKRYSWFRNVGMILGVAMILFTGCSRNVQTTKLQDVDLSQYSTYAWLPTGDTLDFSNQDPSAAIGIRNKINSELQEMGYTVDTKDPDFLVLVHTRYNEEIEYQSTVPAGYNYYGPGFYAGPSYNYYYPYYGSIGYIGGGYVEPVEYTVGTVVVDIIDTRNKEIVWRGTASDEIYAAWDDREEIVEEMVEEVDEIMEEFNEERG